MKEALNDGDRLALMEEFLTCMLTEHSLEKSVKSLYRFLSVHIPFNQIVGFVIDKRQARLTPWGLMEEGEVVPIGEAIDLHFDDLAESCALNWQDEEKTVFIENDATANVHIARYADCFLRGKHATLGAVLHDTPGYRFGISFQSTGEGRFTSRHAGILCAVKEFLTRLVLRFFGDMPQFQPLPERLSPLERLRRCRGLRDVVRMIEAVAPTESLVLIQGETGVGKELAADSIHLLSSRKNGPLVKVNCSAMADTLIDSELFGHEKGAFTSASAMHQGYFEQAHNGTLFLDEIGDLSPGAQARLLRALETREIRRVGGQRRIPVNVRLIAATHKNLADMVEAGEFRQDLWFRLLVFPVVIPPLRQRREDIATLATYAWTVKAEELNLKPAPALSREALSGMCHFSWPGNVRQLMHCVERALIVAHSRGEPFVSSVPIGPAASAGSKQGQDAPLTLDERMAQRIREALRECGGRIHGPDGAAERLGVHPNTLRGRMKRLGIPFPRQERARSAR